jgi:hypothetical protein
VFAVPARIQQASDNPFVGLLGIVGKEVVYLLQRRRQAGQVEGYTANQSSL